jgi:glycerol-3-phosphate O-acyltransferase
MRFKAKLKQAQNSKEISDKIYNICLQLYESYSASLEAQGFSMVPFEHLFEELLFLVLKHVHTPYQFEPYHHKITQPYNYYRFGIEFIRPIVDKSKSYVYLPQNLEKMQTQLKKQESVILFANHQTEVDPQLMSLMLEESYPQLGEEVIFVAGDRVITDPVAVPFSMGRNLLCIYSKRHIDNPPEKKEEKLQHNQKTMHRMKELLSEGGKFIYVAPSGGRDRPDKKSGEVVVAPFDPPSIEMFRLMAKQAHRPVHFYPLSLVTYDILPPPPSVETDVGEIRHAKREGALFTFGDEIDMETFPGSESTDRHIKREARAQYIWNLVNTNYVILKQKVQQRCTD